MKNATASAGSAEPHHFPCEDIINTAARNLLKGHYELHPHGVLVKFTEARYSEAFEEYVYERFEVGFFGVTDSIEIRHVDKQGTLSFSMHPLRSECQKRYDSDNTLEARLGWLVRAFAHPQGQVSLDWGGTDHFGAVIWLVAQGLLKTTPDVDANSLGGCWNRAFITDKGLQHVASMPVVKVYEDPMGEFALDAAGCLINHASSKEKTPRWIRVKKIPDLKQAVQTATLSVMEFHQQRWAYPQLG